MVAFSDTINAPSKTSCLEKIFHARRNNYGSIIKKRVIHKGDKSSMEEHMKLSGTELPPGLANAHIEHKDTPNLTL